METSDAVEMRIGKRGSQLTVPPRASEPCSSLSLHTRTKNLPSRMNLEQRDPFP